MTKSIRHSRGFTLIELLVVVAIIALLIAILLPSLGQARNLARRTVCAANLSGIGKTLQIYDAENGRYPLNLREADPNRNFGDYLYYDDSNNSHPMTRSWSNMPMLIYSRGDTKADMRFSFGWRPTGGATGGMGSGKIYACPGPSPQTYPYKGDEADYAYPSSPRMDFYNSNYVFMWANPGNHPISTAANANLFARLDGTLLKKGEYVGAKSSKDAPGTLLAGDFVASEIGGSAPLGYSNHGKGAVRSDWKSGSYRFTATGTGPADSFTGWGTGGNMLYNDGHAEFKTVRDLYPTVFNAVLSGSSASKTVYYLDLPTNLR